MAKRSSAYFSREWILYTTLIVIAVLIMGKLIYLQIFNSSELIARGATFRVNSQAMIYERGMILDAQGNIMAKSVRAQDIYADPRTLRKTIMKREANMPQEKVDQELAKIAKDISAIIGKSDEEIKQLLVKDLSWVSIARQVDLTKTMQIAELKIPGVGFTDTYKRVYPTGSMAASIIGIVNMAGDGVEGVEYAYNAELKGEKEYKTPDTVSESSSDEGKIKPGYNLTLTIDSTIQHLVEQELDKIMEESHPQKAVILAMDPMTGKILGMGSRPSFDPNQYSKTDPKDRKNLAINMIYEPGSTFKIITGAAALEENIITPEQIFYDPGYLVVGSRRITNWDSDRKAHGNISFANGMLLSSNVVLAKVGEALGKDMFYTYLRSFGFGSKTKIDIAGEERGLLIDVDRVKELELATMSFGQANLVTPIQLLTAISAVANGGSLIQPFVVEKITDKDQKLLYQNSSRVTREVVSKSTSDVMTKILTDVVDKGTGSRAKIPGMKVAGKTGTAQKIDPETGRYSATDFIASFVAYAPSDNPKIAVLVVLDTPQGEIIQGGTLAGPHAKNIIEDTLQYYGIPVSASTPSKLGNLEEIDITPPPEKPSPKPTTPSRTPGQGEVLVPDLTGLTIRQAGAALGKLDLRYYFSGSGLATQQKPEAGRIVNQGDMIKVIFSVEDQDALGKEN